MSVAVVGGLVSLAATLIGGCIALVNLGVKVGRLTSKVDELDNDNFHFGENNRERFNEMAKQDNEQSQSIALLKQGLESISKDLVEIKDDLKSLNAYVRQAERDRVALESRVDFLERRTEGKKQ